MNFIEMQCVDQNFVILLQQKASSFFIIFFQSYETDNNRDGKNDVLNFEIQVPTKSTENIHSVQLLMFFDYKLHVSFNHFFLSLSSS